MGKWLLNGTTAETIDIDSRALQYGDGLFETIAVREGKVRLWDYHAARLRDGCERLGLICPDTEDCRARIEDLGEENAAAKLIVAARPRRRGYARVSGETDVLLRTFEYQPLPADCYRDGIPTILCDTRLAVGSPVAGLKTLNRIEQVLARNEVAAAGYIEGLTRDVDGNVICGTMSNVFTVQNNKLVTPSVDRCGVAGVMRRHLMATARAAGLQLEERVLASIDDADEVFLCNSQLGVVPVNRCGDLGWSVGEMTRSVIRMLAENGVVEPGK